MEKRPAVGWPKGNATCGNGSASKLAGGRKRHAPEGGTPPTAPPPGPSPTDRPTADLRGTSASSRLGLSIVGTRTRRTDSPIMNRARVALALWVLAAILA